MLVQQSPVMLFMEGTPESPTTEESLKTIDLLIANQIPFNTFDISSDGDIASMLQSSYPSIITFPQLFVNGALVGGCNALNKMLSQIDSAGSLKQQLGITSMSLNDIISMSKFDHLHDKLKTLITSAPVVVFVKGTPETPKCGFSRNIMNLLKEENISFRYFNILLDKEVREELKIYSEWPTYPQMYVQGSLVGGLDILKEMQAEGNLKTQLNLE